MLEFADWLSSINDTYPGYGALCLLAALYVSCKQYTFCL